MTNASVLYRRSAALFHYRGDVDALGRPITVNGRVGTFTRASTRWAIDSAGRLYQAAAGQLARHTLFDLSGVAVSSGLILGPSQTNLIGSPDDQTVGAGWGASGGIALTAGQGPFAGRPMTRVTSTFANVHTRSVTFSSSGAKAFGTLYKHISGTPTSQGIAGVWDASALVMRGRIAVTVTGGGAISFAISSGATNLVVQKLADDVYFVSATANGVVHTNPNVYYGVNTTSVFDAYFGGATVLNVPTMAVPYGQTALDDLRFSCRFAVRELTALIDYTTIGYEQIAAARLFRVGHPTVLASYPELEITNSSGPSPDAIYYNAAGLFSASTNGGAALPAFGSRVRYRVVLSTAGAVRLYASYGTGAEASRALGTARGIDATQWAGGDAAEIRIGTAPTVSEQGSILFQSLRFGSGTRDLTQMEALV